MSHVKDPAKSFQTCYPYNACMKIVMAVWGRMQLLNCIEALFSPATPLDPFGPEGPCNPDCPVAPGNVETSLFIF